MKIPNPRPAATQSGTVMLLGDTGDLAADVQAALVAAGSEPFPIEGIKRLLAYDQEARGLRAEAGYWSGPASVNFFTRMERLATGVRAHLFLRLMRTPPGDAVFWSVSVSSGEWVLSATRDGADEILTMLRDAAGGPSTEVNEYPADDLT
jgi:hypothetical protein